MKKVLFFIFDGMTDYEVTLAMHFLGADAGMEVITASYDGKVVKSRSGAMYKPHEVLRNVDGRDLEGIVICGGWFGDFRPELDQLIRKVHSENKLVSGICGAGTFMLAKAGVLEDKAYTSPIAQWTKKHQEVFGPDDPFPRQNHRTGKVIRDKNVITGLGEAFVDFAIEICDWFRLFDNEDEKSSFASFMKGA